MNLSELIQKLEKQLAARGDVEVLLAGDPEGNKYWHLDFATPEMYNDYVDPPVSDYRRQCVVLWPAYSTGY